MSSNLSGLSVAMFGNCCGVRGQDEVIARHFGWEAARGFFPARTTVRGHWTALYATVL